MQKDDCHVQNDIVLHPISQDHFCFISYGRPDKTFEKIPFHTFLLACFDPFLNLRIFLYRSHTNTLYLIN